MRRKQGTLYLIPNTLGQSRIEDVIPSGVSEVVGGLKHFIVEDVKTCKKFIRAVNKEVDMFFVEFYELNEHSTASDVADCMRPLYDGNDVGLISEAGCPAVADPGSDVVAIALSKGYRVVPLVGPSSIILSLMASGFNGQNFAFMGYLPIEKQHRTKMIHKMEKRIIFENQTQIFIETPYRNNALIADLCSVCVKGMRLCVAANLTLENEDVRNMSIEQWKKEKYDYNKQPCIFLLYK